MTTVYDRKGTYTAIVTGEAEASRVAAELTHRSQWFTSEPMPDDQWEITVKQENAAMLKTIARTYKPAADIAGSSANRFIAECDRIDREIAARVKTRE